MGGEGAAMTRTARRSLGVLREVEIEVERMELDRMARMESPHSSVG